MSPQMENASHVSRSKFSTPSVDADPQSSIAIKEKSRTYCQKSGPNCTWRAENKVNKLVSSSSQKKKEKKNSHINSNSECAIAYADPISKLAKKERDKQLAPVQELRAN